MSGFYAIYHGPEGLKEIATRINGLTKDLANKLIDKGLEIKSETFFDTLVVKVKDAKKIHEKANANGMNLRDISNDSVGVSLDETSTQDDVKAIIEIFDDEQNKNSKIEQSWSKEFDRATAFLTHEVFNSHHSETQILRYIRSLSDKDWAVFF